ncbi:MAG: OprD family outer membrane porin, partial [Sulfuricurvum sp.]|nr:OprD family outer membrane porin [Sulfuricurvum sp.]
MKLVNLSIAAAAACLFATSAHALKTEDRNLKANGQVEYLKVPGAVNSIGEMFTEGEFYGRLRSNMFWWDWDNAVAGKTADNNMWGLGGSLVYKTGFYKGFGATAGFYGTVPMHDDNLVGTSVTNYGKAGKDTYRTRLDGTEAAIGVVAEAYGEYKAGKTDVTVGRQMIDSIMLASNDTKMVPNTFEAAMIENKDISNTKIRAGYIMSQKLRDHQSFHSILAYDGTTTPAKVNENDDSGVHKGLSLKNIASLKEDANPEMILITAENKSIPNLKLDAEYVGIKGFFSTAIAEANYQVALGNGWTLTPGIRYLKQMDDGAGKIGGAALNGSLGNDKSGVGYNTAAASYRDPKSADGSILMERLVLANGPLSVMAGYSDVSDDADIIAPWRGFPTGGYTRDMAQVNWIANTQSWMVKADYNFDKAGIVPGLIGALSYADMNFDDKKMIAVASDFSDRSIVHLDLIQTFKTLPNTEFKFRFAAIDADPSKKTD